MASELSTVGWEVRHLRVRIGRAVLLEGVDAKIRAGRLTVLVGPNGAGKSTLLKTLSGDLVPDAGEVSFAGMPLRAWDSGALARRRAILPQAVEMNFPFTALEVVLLGRSPHHGFEARPEDWRIADEALAWVGATDLANRPFPVLSGGEQQRVHLARILAQVAVEPPGEGYGLLLDEPLAALDLGHQWEVMRLLRSLAEQGAAVGLVVHDLNIALRWADEVILLDEGRCVAQGPPEETLTPQTVSRIWKLPMRQVVLEAGGPAFLFPEEESGRMRTRSGR
jgi:iron complex transport system ATP-binding protein